MTDRELLSGWAVSIGRHVGVGVLGLIWLIVLTRATAPDDVGVLVLVASLPALVVPLANLGVPMGLAYLVAVADEDASGLAGWARATALRLGAAAAMVATLVVSGVQLVAPDVDAAVLAGASSIPAAIVTSVVVGWVQGQRRFGVQARLMVLPHLLTMVGTVALWAAGQLGVAAVVAVIVVSHMATAAVAFRIVSRATHGDIAGVGSRVWSYSWRVWVSEAGAALRARLDLVVVAAMLGTTDAGLFAAATTLAAQLAVLSLGANQVVFPIVAARAGGAADATAAASRLTFAGTLVAAGVIAVAAQPVLELIYGEPFADGATVLVAYLPAVVLLSVSRIVTADLYGRGEAGLVARLSLVATGIGIALLPVGIYLWSGTGAAIATSVTAAINTGLRVWAWRRLVAEPRPSLVAISRGDMGGVVSALRSGVARPVRDASEASDAYRWIRR